MIETTSDGANEQNRIGAIPLLFVLTVWIAAAGFSQIRYQPLPVVQADVKTDLFSAERAEVIFSDLYENAVPHPAGNNDPFRQQVIGHFQRYGYPVELHRSSGVPRNDRTTDDTVPLVNLIARLEGTSDLPPVMLSAHYDSHPVGPGAADDGVGVTALLEIARMLQNEPRPERSIIFLLSDGEEFGLLGSRAFVNEHPLADRIAAVINLEARGTGGPSLMFETSDESAWLVELFARAARRPLASSMFFEVYRFLPNNTDFTVFREHGMQGFNFAFIGDVRNYHTPADRFQNVDRRSLQHHGENALALLRELVNTDIENQPTGRAVYFDVFGMVVIRWPAAYSLWMSMAGLVFVVCCWRWYGFPRKSDGRLVLSLVKSGAFGLGGMLVVAIVCEMVDFGFMLDNTTEHPFPPHPVPIQASFWSLGATATFAWVWLFGERMSWRAIWFGGWSMWAVLAVFTSIWLVGASYLFVVPLMVACIAATTGLFINDENKKAVAVAVAGISATGLLWIPMERLFYDALGFSMNVALVFRVTLLLPLFLPLLVITRRRVILWATFASLAVSVVLVLWSVLLN